MVINGYRVIASYPTARMQLSDNVPVTDEFRAEMNLWMRGFFGYNEPVVKKGQAIVIEVQKTMLVHPDDFWQLQREWQNSEPPVSYGFRKPSIFNDWGLS